MNTKALTSTHCLVHEHLSNNDITTCDENEVDNS